MTAAKLITEEIRNINFNDNLYHDPDAIKENKSFENIVYPNICWNKIICCCTKTQYFNSPFETFRKFKILIILKYLGSRVYCVLCRY